MPASRQLAGNRPGARRDGRAVRSRDDRPALRRHARARDRRSHRGAQPRGRATLGARRDGADRAREPARAAARRRAGRAVRARGGNRLRDDLAILAIRVVERGARQMRKARSRSCSLLGRDAPPASADCRLHRGEHVVLYSTTDDPSVLIWDSRARLREYHAASFDEAQAMLPHALLVSPGTHADVVSCVAGLRRVADLPLARRRDRRRHFERTAARAHALGARFRRAACSTH